MMAQPTKDDWQFERIGEARCPMCGSPRVRSSDDGWDSETGTENPFGWDCPDCGFFADSLSDLPDFPFIAPGEPGSHDTPEDYPDAGTDA